MSESTHGTQVVSRVAGILRVVSAHPGGISSVAIAHATGLTRPTTHRILSSLAAEGFVDQDTHNRRWLLGPELYLLGSVAGERYDITEVARPSVELLARETGESAFLSARRGWETVCLLREEGSFPVRSFVLHEGVRFPLGVASAGLSILAYLTDAEIEEYLAKADLRNRWGAAHDAQPLRDRVTRTRQAGYAVNPALILEGSWGMGAAVFDAAGRPAWALSLTGIESRFRAERQPELGRLLLEQAHELSKKLRG